MKGDIIIVEEHHRSAARAIAAAYLPEIENRECRSMLTVAGESGSGKSETARAVADELEAHGIPCVVLQQDDYFVLPPRTNDRARRANLLWVGPTEVRLDLLDEHLQAARDGRDHLVKPLVIYEEDHIDEETVDLAGARVVIAEGTYTSLLANVDRRVFIARHRLETLEHRRKRGREQLDPFIERVLEIEHGIIAPHRELADAVITSDYRVELVER
ncbi:MAG TPA: zeta toxin family protein [Acidimicrobiia bacterium]|nr:zeta toxin family protein [Acidimicrobiia bacterium]